VRPAAPGRRGVLVTWEQRHAYVAAAAAAHAAIWRPAADAMRRGLESVLPRTGLALLTWRELERRVCGDRTVTAAALRAITRSGISDQPQEAWLWQIIDEMDDAQRSAFLAFATGRSRLPAAPQMGQLELDMDEPREEPLKPGDHLLPSASTCAFTFHTPWADSLEQLRDGILYAIENCRAIDLDGDPHGEMMAVLPRGARESGSRDADALPLEDSSGALVPLFDATEAEASETNAASGGDSDDDADSQASQAGQGFARQEEEQEDGDAFEELFDEEEEEEEEEEQDDEDE
jgi:hypothetical protein